MKKVLLVLLLTTIVSCVSCKKEENIQSSSENGIYRVNCTIDDCVTLPFILDTGASDTSIPYYVALTLFKAEKIKQEDILESKTYLLADGSLMKTDRVIIHKIVIGNHEFREVEVSVSDNPNSPILLGQNILSQLEYMKIDYKKDIVIFK